VLVDTSVWIDHFRRRNATLTGLLEQGHVWTHELVIGELACGNLGNRAGILGYLAELPRVSVASHEEVLRLLEARRLMGRGLGWIDLHLLASSVIAKIPFWSMDRRLSLAARQLGLHVPH
jgi:predicted nucleic acid-binding protein